MIAYLSCYPSTVVGWSFYSLIQDPERPRFCLRRSRFMSRGMCLCPGFHPSEMVQSKVGPYDKSIEGE